MTFTDSLHIHFSATGGVGALGSTKEIKNNTIVKSKQPDVYKNKTIIDILFYFWNIRILTLLAHLYQLPLH